MTAASVKVSSLITTSPPSNTLNSASEPSEVFDFQRTFNTTLAETVAALDHVMLPTVIATTPAAGEVGELISSAVLVAATKSLTTATPLDITSVTLTPGDWEVTGNFSVVLGSATCTAVKASTGTTAATHGLAQHGTDLAPLTTTASATLSHPIPTRHVQVAAGATQVIYLVATATFSAGTATGHGVLNARRAS
jgi:hypothetical protein